MTVLKVILGPPEHGVTRHAAVLAAGRGRTVPDASALRAVLRSTHSAIHLHVTDALLGANAEEVEVTLQALAAHAPGVHLTLHDIPQPAEGSARFERRAQLYRGLCDLAATVQVCSESERKQLQNLGIATDDIHVVRLPIDPRPVPRPATAGAKTLGVLGFVHPGKNIELAIDVAASHGMDVTVLGGAADGHESYTEELVQQAAQQGVRLDVLGHLSEREMDAAIAEVHIPIAPYRHISASGSIGRWISAGRRPIVVRTGWTGELYARAPWAVTPAEVHDFPAAVATARTDEDTTWISQFSSGGGLSSTSDAVLAQQRVLDGGVNVDVVVTHYHDERRLGWVLHALSTQDYDAGTIQVTVADDGSAARPDSVLAQYPDVGCVRQDDRGFRAAAARNLGARQGEAPIVIFLDGDTIPTRSFVRQLVQGLHDADIVVGHRQHACLDQTCDDEVAHWTRSATSMPDQRRLNDPTWLKEGYQRTRDLSEMTGDDWRYVISACLGMRRTLFTDLEGFDASLVGYGGEDWDFAYRAWNHGARFRYVAAAVAWHDGPDAGERAQLATWKEGEQLALAERIPQPRVRGRGGYWDYPRLVVQVTAATVWAPRAAYAVVESWLRLGDVGVWHDGVVGEAFAHDPRVYQGSPSPEVLRRCEIHVSLRGATALRPGVRLDDLMALAPFHTDALVAVTTRQLRQGRVSRRLDEMDIAQPVNCDLDLEEWGLSQWS